MYKWSASGLTFSTTSRCPPCFSTLPRSFVDVIRADHYPQAVHLATQLAVLLRAQYWGMPVQGAEFQRSTQDWTRPELDGYTVWLVEWTQTVYLGELSWPWPDEPPGSLLISVNREDYVAPEDL